MELYRPEIARDLIVPENLGRIKQLVDPKTISEKDGKTPLYLNLESALDSFAGMYFNNGKQDLLDRDWPRLIGKCLCPEHMAWVDSQVAQFPQQNKPYTVALMDRPWIEFQKEFLRYIGCVYSKEEEKLFSYLWIKMVCDNLGSLERYNDDFSAARNRTHLKDDECLAIKLYVNGLSREVQNQVRGFMMTVQSSYNTVAEVSKLALKVRDELEATGDNGEDGNGRTSFHNMLDKKTTDFYLNNDMVYFKLTADGSFVPEKRS